MLHAGTSNSRCQSRMVSARRPESSRLQTQGVHNLPNVSEGFVITLRRVPKVLAVAGCSAIGVNPRQGSVSTYIFNGQ
jgi:hypothetical protein